MLWCSQVHVGLTNARGERYQSYLGGYSNKSDAIAAYKSSKISHIKNTALEFQEKIPAILFYKLYLGAENYVDYYMHHKEEQIENY